MIKINKLPDGYESYSSLSVCGNKLYGDTKIIAVGQILPLLIGRGSTKPQIWIQALQNPQSKKYILLVDASISKHPLVRVEELGRQIIVTVNGGTILRIEQTGPDQAVVSELDLRSIGFNVHGGMSQLSVGGMTFSNTSVSGAGVMVAIG